MSDAASSQSIHDRTHDEAVIGLKKTIRLKAGEDKCLRQLVDSGRYRRPSDVLRDAARIAAYQRARSGLDANAITTTTGCTTRRTFRYPEGVNADLEALVDNDVYASVSAAVRDGLHVVLADHQAAIYGVTHGE